MKYKKSVELASRLDGVEKRVRRIKTLDLHALQQAYHEGMSENIRKLKKED